MNQWAAQTLVAAGSGILGAIGAGAAAYWTMVRAYFPFVAQKTPNTALAKEIGMMDKSLSLHQAYGQEMDTGRERVIKRGEYLSPQQHSIFIPRL